MFLGHGVGKIYNLHWPNDHIQTKGIMNIYNLILYIGLALMALGLITFFVSCIMERYYDKKLRDVDKKIRAHDSWRNKNWHNNNYGIILDYDNA